MENEALWRAFARTGDPVYYLLYRHLADMSIQAE